MRTEQVTCEDSRSIRSALYRRALLYLFGCLCHFAMHRKTDPCLTRKKLDEITVSI